MRSSVVLRGAAGGLLAALLIAAPAAAFELNGGCTMTITSTDAAGGALDTASGAPDGGVGATREDPFLIDWDGTVSWNASSEPVAFTDHTWGISVFLIPTPVRGGDPNAGGDTTGDGTAVVSENAPFRTTGLYHVSGAIDGAALPRDRRCLRCDAIRCGASWAGCSSASACRWWWRCSGSPRSAS